MIFKRLHIVYSRLEQIFVFAFKDYRNYTTNNEKKIEFCKYCREVKKPDGMKLAS